MLLRFILTAAAFAVVLYLQFSVDLKTWVASATRSESSDTELHLAR